MGVTIKDVALRAKVSPSTVSRVLANSPRISARTQERVREAMRALGYHRNAIARSLVTQTSSTLGLIMSRSAELAFSNPFFPEVIRGIGALAREYGYSLLLSTSSTPWEERVECLQMLRGRRADGVILLASRVEDELIGELLAEGYPFVVVGRVPGHEEVRWVNNDNVAAARLAVEHLLALGHRRIGLIGGMADFVVSQDRLAGYQAALASAGVPYDPDMTVETDFTLEGGYRAALQLLQRSLRPTALFAMDDLLAIGALRALKERGLKVPRDAALVGFNDDPLATVVEPALTTVRIPIYELGATAARMLVAALRSEPGPRAPVVLPARLVVRESCGAAASPKER